MNLRLLVSVPLFLALAGPSGRASAGRRDTNVEVRILSQSCFQGEVTPCG